VRAVPGIGWVIAGGILVVALARLPALSISARGAARGASAHADSVARAKTLEAVILRRDAPAARARADSIERRADSLAASSPRRARTSRRRRPRGRVARARVDRRASGRTSSRRSPPATRSASRSRIPPARLGDDRRLSETPALEYSHTIELHVGAYAEQGAALVARESQARALAQEHKPRCGWKCGAVIGASVALVAVGGLTYLVAAAAAP
jgi:hypothetical protein